MSRKDNLRDPSRRARILSKRTSPMTGLFPVTQGTIKVPTFMQRLKAKLSKSKYTPHFGAKQSAKLAGSWAAA